jgi:microcystin-dependent protein
VVDSFATGKTQAVEPSFGSYVDTWNIPCNSNFGVIDAALSGSTPINVSSVSSSSPFINITFSQFNATANPTPWTNPNAGQNLNINLTGVLTFNITVYLQQTPGFWIISNNTSGSFAITVATTAPSGTSIQLPQGFSSLVYSNGTNVSFADLGGAIYAINNFVPSSVPVGAIMPFYGSTVPNSCWLACDGATYSRTTYSKLFAYIGTIWGVGDGSTTFNVPFLNQGAFLRGVGGNAAAEGVQQAQMVGPGLGITDPGHVHGPGGQTQMTNPPGYLMSNSGTGWSGITGGPGGPIYYTPTTASATTGITLTGAGIETRPMNYSVFYCIRAL